MSDAATTRDDVELAPYEWTDFRRKGPPSPRYIDTKHRASIEGMNAGAKVTAEGHGAVLGVVGMIGAAADAVARYLNQQEINAALDGVGGKVVRRLNAKHSVVGGALIQVYFRRSSQMKVRATIEGTARLLRYALKEYRDHYKATWTHENAVVRLVWAARY